MYYVAVPNRDAAVSIVKQSLGDVAMTIEACRLLPVLINGVALKPGTLRELYRREIKGPAIRPLKIAGSARPIPT
jgi:hypothetical protein